MRKRSKWPALESLEDRHFLTGTIGLSIDLVEVQESDGTVTITLLRSGDLDGLATVDYTTVADSAKEDNDFSPISGTFTFESGVTGQQIQIPITNDDESELPALFRFELSNPTGGSELGRASQTIRIIDDDTESSLLFADNFERGVRWFIDPVQTDTAILGQWEVGAPQATEWNSQTIQPSSTAEGQRALVTGAARVAGATSNDVDGGLTTAISPVINLPPDELIDLSFAYFFGHAPGSSADDYLRVSVLSVSDSNTSADAETVFEVFGTSSARPADWRTELLDLSSYSGQSVQIVVAANDSGGESILEAGIDNVWVDVLPDSPGTISFAGSIVNVVEGPNATATLELIRARGRTGVVSVEVVATDDGATGGEDYVPFTETITFADGITSQTVTISVTNDNVEEALENIEVTLQNPGGGSTLGSDSRATVRIVDDDRFLRGLLPDLVPLEDNFDANYIDVSEQPGRAVYRFGTAVANSGDGPLEIWGGETSGTTQEVLQRIYEAGGDSYDRLAGSFIYHAGHGHVHLEGFATFNLRAVEENGEVGDIVASGGKTSFCLLNISHPFPAATSASSRPHGRGGEDCNTIQGISVGHADVYDASLEGQWIDVTELADGDYFLEVVADPDDSLLELDETNNVFHALVNVDNPYYVNGEFVENPQTPPSNNGQQSQPPEDATLLEGTQDRIGASSKWNPRPTGIALKRSEVPATVLKFRSPPPHPPSGILSCVCEMRTEMNSTTMTMAEKDSAPPSLGSHRTMVCFISKWVHLVLARAAIASTSGNSATTTAATRRPPLH